jgi:hypothetical protein
MERQLDSFPPMGNAPWPAPQAPKVKRIRTEKGLRERAVKFKSEPELFTNYYGAYNKKLPSLTLKRKAFANFQRFDPDKSRSLDDAQWNRTWNLEMRRQRDQGTMNVREPALTVPMPDRGRDFAINVYDAFQTAYRISESFWGDAPGMSRLVDIRDNVPGDVAQQVMDETRFKPAKYAQQANRMFSATRLMSGEMT